VGLIRPSTVAVAALIDSSALYHAFLRHDLDQSAAVVRFLVAVPVSAAMLAMLRAITAPYRGPGRTIRAVAERLDTPQRRSTDRPGDQHADQQ
jgi:cobalamin synthase